jgi:hypothetical protein
MEAFMKRLILSTSPFVLASLLLTSLSYGGSSQGAKFERRYWDPLVEQNMPMQDKSFQHTSPTQREQNEISPPQKGSTNPNQPAGKFERRYWTPTQE